jgi:hypothetical protein
MAPLGKTRHRLRRLETTRRRIRSLPPRRGGGRRLAIPNHKQLVLFPLVRLETVEVPSWQVGRLGAVLARSESERCKVPRTDVRVQQHDLFRVAMMQRRRRRDVERDQSAGYEEQLHESRRRTEVGVRGTRREAKRTDLYCPLNPFRVNTLPALTILLHVLSGHQL